MYRSAVQKAMKEGLPVMGDQSKQTFSSQFIEEALILSDLFQMSEIAAVELLMAGGSIVWTILVFVWHILVFVWTIQYLRIESQNIQ